MQTLTHPQVLSEHLRAMTARGWRVETTSDIRAMVSRPVVWMPPWLTLLLVLTTGPIGLGLWAGRQSPRATRRRRLVTVTPDGAILVTGGAV